MEPLALKCTSCETEWKIFKAGRDPVLCPKCQAPATLPEGFASPAPIQPTTPPIDPPSESVPLPETPPLPAVVEPPPPPVIPEPPPLPVRPFREPLEHDDEERDYSEPDYYIPAPRRSGMHPLVVVIIILLLIFVLLPLAVIVLFWAMCALSV